MYSRINCSTPSQIQLRPKFYGGSSYDYSGNLLRKTPGHQAKDIYEFRKSRNQYIFVATYRDRLRDLSLEGIDMQWGKKCIGYDEDEKARMESILQVRSNFSFLVSMFLSVFG